MATEVELSGMTINLVPDKETYEGMEKNANEMYLVQDDYDMVIEISPVQGSSVFAQARVVSGNFEDVFSKVESSNNTPPTVLIKGNLYYGTVLTYIKQIATPVSQYWSSERGMRMTIPWVYANSACSVYIKENGEVGADYAFMSTF